MSRALPFYSPTPRHLRRPDHPNLFLLGFSPKLILWLSSFCFKLFLRQASREVLWLSSFFQNRSCGKQAGRAVRQGQGRAGQGRAGQGRAGQGRAGQGRAGQGRAGQGRAGQGRAGQGRAGQGRAGGAGQGQRKAAAGRAPGAGGARGL